MRLCWCLWESFRVHGGPWGPKGAQGSPKADVGHILGSFWEPSGSTFGVILAHNFEIGGITSTFWCPFSGFGKRSQNGAPQGGGDMRSAHAGACFVRVGRCRVGSILGSILESFWHGWPPFWRPVHHKGHSGAARGSLLHTLAAQGELGGICGGSTPVSKGGGA